MLDYAVPKPHARFEEWPWRILLAILVLVCLYGALLAWLYWGWKQEQPAKATVARLNGTIVAAPMAGSSRLQKIVPERLQWVLDRITEISLWDSELTDADLTAIGGLKGLQKLDLRGSKNITDTGLAHLERLEDLCCLNIQGAHITDGGLAHLAGLRGLTYLSLSDTAVSEVGMVHLARMTALRWLDLSRTHMTDAGIAHIEALPLEILALNNTHITDEGLRDIAGMPKLVFVELTGTDVSPSGVVEAQRKRPRLIMTRWDIPTGPLNPPPDLEPSECIDMSLDS